MFLREARFPIFRRFAPLFLDLLFLLCLFLGRQRPAVVFKKLLERGAVDQNDSGYVDIS